MVDVFNFRITRKPKEPDSKVIPKPSYMGLPQDKADSGDLTKTDLGDTFAKEALIQKGIWKKNKDLFGGGWHVVHKENDKDVDEADQKLIQDFDHKSQIKKKISLAGVSSDIYGDGFIEKLYEEPLTDTSEMPVPETAKLVDLNVLRGEYISKFEPKLYNDPQKYYILEQGGGIAKQYFHPERLCHVAEKTIPGRLFGISRIYIGRNIIDAKIKADRNYGSFIEWAGSGVFDMTYTGANPDDIQKLAEIYRTRKKILIHDEKEVWQAINPSVFNPDPFNMFFYINIAALVDMPWYVLAGVSPGQLTGSEIGISDYYKTLMNLQETIYTPILEDIYTDLLEGEGRSFENYKIEWNPIFVDETSEATILKMNTETAVAAVNANMITEEEGRRIMQNGIQDKDGNPVLSEEMPEIEPEPILVVQPGMKPGQPGQKPQQPPQQKPQKQDGWLTAEEKVRFEHERLLGQLELELQERRLKDAEKKTKKQ